MFWSPFRWHWFACWGHKSLYHVWWTSKGLTLIFLKCLLAFHSILKTDVIFNYGILAMGHAQSVSQYFFMAFPCLFGGSHLSIIFACLHIDSSYVHLKSKYIVRTISYKWHGFFQHIDWLLFFAWNSYLFLHTDTRARERTYTHSFYQTCTLGANFIHLTSN
jgi:hypothetical protein